MPPAPQDVAVRALEFWTTVANEEAELGDDAAENRKYTMTALVPLVNMLLELMTKQKSEDDGDEEYSIAQAAANCVSSVVSATGDAALARVLPFVQLWFGSADWRQRDAATLALGLVMNGPNEASLKPVVTSALPMLLTKLVGPSRDPSAAVRDTTAWTVGNIFTEQYELIDKANIAGIVTTLISALADEARVAANVAYVRWAVGVDRAQALRIDQTSFPHPRRRSTTSR